MIKLTINEQEAKRLSEEGKDVITVMYQKIGRIGIKDRQKEYVTAEKARDIFDSEIVGYETFIR